MQSLNNSVTDTPKISDLCDDTYLCLGHCDVGC